VSRHIVAVSPESFSDSAVIRNILALGIHSVQLTFFKRINIFKKERKKRNV
jgi:hypothetical protein